MGEPTISNTIFSTSSDPHLHDGESLKAPSNNYITKMNSDGNLVLYDNGPIWASQTGGKGKGPFSLKVQGDGNLCIYSSDIGATWSSNSWGRGSPPYKLIMQDDRNLVFCDSYGRTVWHTNSAK